MTTIQAFLLGIMVMLTPSMLLLALLLCKESTYGSDRSGLRIVDDAVFETDLCD